jgi:hypothetical protein
VTALLAEDPSGIEVAIGAAVFDRRFHGSHSKSLGGEQDIGRKATWPWSKVGGSKRPSSPCGVGSRRGGGMDCSGSRPQPDFCR